MRVVRLRRGYRVNVTDNEYELMRAALNHGLKAMEAFRLDERLGYKVHKVLYSQRWEMPGGPLFVDDDRRPDLTPLGPDLAGDLQAGESHEPMEPSRSH